MFFKGKVCVNFSKKRVNCIVIQFTLQLKPYAFEKHFGSIN